MDLRHVRRTLRTVLDALGVWDHEVSLTLVDDREIRALSLTERLDLAGRILNEAAAGDVGAAGPARSLLQLEGLGADLWAGRDAQESVDQLRREWSGRP